jgi:hypothetical protein
MRLSFLADLYRSDGPFASAYIATERDVELAPQEIELRLRAVRRELEHEGCDEEPTLHAIEERVGSDRTIGKPQGQAVFAAKGEVRLIAELEQPPPDGGWGRWAPLPHVMPMLSRLRAHVPHVRVSVDRAGAIITAVSADGSETRARFEGEQQPLRKISPGDWSQNRWQRRAEATWDRNARGAAERVVALASRVGAELVVVGGDVRAVALLREHLPVPWNELVAEVDTRDGDDAADAERFEKAARQAAQRLVDERHQQLAERFEQVRGTGYTVEGFPETVSALAEGRVDVLLLRDHPESPAKLWFGPELRQAATTREALSAQGVDEPRRDRADAVIARAVTGGSAALELCGDDLRLHDDIGALLRF